MFSHRLIFIVNNIFNIGCLTVQYRLYWTQISYIGLGCASSNIAFFVQYNLYWTVNHPILYNIYIFVGLGPVNQILCLVWARGWGRWLRYFTEAKPEVKYRASARIRGPKHGTRFEWPVSIIIMTRYPFLPFKTHKTSVNYPRLLTIAGAIWFCRSRQCTPSQLWMHAPVANEPRLMTSQYHIFDRMDNSNPHWMQAVNG